ncbi:MAG: FAD-dependent oxidoreductase [Alphaproteobacteria bacterium]|nr:FAD-dependent oxidoreductase [Alphaproteobacteria bacterium]
MVSSVDIAVIGAGAAGIAAARALRAAGASHIVLEAAARLGGRALTDHSLGYALDLGCTWLHSADRNPLADGPPAQYGQDAPRSRLFRDDLGRWASPAEETAHDAYIARCEAAVEAVAARGEDPPVADAVPDDPDWRRHFEWWCGAYTSVGSRDLGALDWARYVDTDRNWTVPHGMGAHIVRRAAGLAIRRETPVLALDRSGPRLRLLTPAGVLEARAVILTAGTEALKRMRFTPALPQATAAAIHRLPLGRANKVLVRFDRLDPDWPSARSGVLSVRVGRFGRPVAESFLEAGAVRALEAEGERAEIAFVLEQYATMFGSGVRRRVRAARASTWGTTPWIWGAYSAMAPGGGDPRADLARPVEDRLFFAGEATHPTFFTAAHGAWASGERAAAEALAAMRDADRRGRG